MTAVAAATYSVEEKQAVVNVKGMLNDANLLVKTTAETPATLVKGTDYTVSYNNDGDMVITLIAGSTYASVTELSVAGKKLNPAGVTASDIVGTVNATTGAETGCEVIRQVYPKLGIVPGLLLAPGWSQNPTVGIALAAKAALINGVFKAMALVDLDTGSGKAIDKNMRELLDYGCSFSLDDYGSGYSNLTYVVNLPVKIIKIDKLITDNYFVSEKVRIATEYTIEMLHKLGMEIVVEGVDSEEKYLAFKKLNAEFIQGFYFSKPLPKDRVLNFIQEWL